jgi:ribonuclease-3
MDSEKLQKFQKQLDVQFKDENLLVNAFVHRSYLNENRGFELPSNERLEFLGDACLELITSEFLFAKYPTEPEGVLTNYRSALVNTDSLSETARDLKLGSYLLLSRGEEAGGGRESRYLLANTFEALLGAIYLDQGYDKAAEVAHKYVLSKIDEIVANETHRDAKSKLQELTQAELSQTPEYSVLGEWGPDHNKTFRVGVVVGNKTIGIGTGSSKQKAELMAAQNALENWHEVMHQQ